MNLPIDEILSLAVESQKSATIRFVVAGDVIVDRWYEVENSAGQTSLSAGQFLLKRDTRIEIGGAPTIAPVTAQFGRTVLVVPVAGKGELADRLIPLIDERVGKSGTAVRNIDLPQVEVAEITRVVQRDFQNSHNQIYRLEVATNYYSKNVGAEIASALDGVTDATAIVADHDRGFVSKSAMDAIDAASTLVVAHAAENWDVFRGVHHLDTIVVRRDQLARCVGAEDPKLDSLQDRHRAASAAIDRTPAPTLIVKDHGLATTEVFYLEDGGSPKVLTIEAIKGLPGRLGGGAAFTSYYGVGRTLGLDPPSAAVLGQLGAVALSMSDRSPLPLISELTRIPQKTRAKLSVTKPRSHRRGDDSTSPARPM